MNTKIVSPIFQNCQMINKKPSENNSILDSNPKKSKDITSNQEHNFNSLFKVVQEEKDSHSQNNLLFINNDKNNKSSSKNINIIKPKFVTKKKSEETPSLNLSLNLSGSAFQPQIILKDKEFKVKVKDKFFNLALDTKNDNLKIKLYEINENVYLLKYFYENNFTMSELKQLHKFFYLFDNISDSMKELEKLLAKYKYNVYEDLENKKAKIHIKFILLEKEENIEFPLLQKIYSKDNLFEILCKKVATITNEYGQKINQLEGENKYLIMNFYRIMNTLNPININYQLNQRGENNINKINNSFNNKININKNISLIKNPSNNENKYNINKENFNNNYEYDEINDLSNDVSNTDNLDDEKEISENKIINRKRKRRASSNSSNKNNNNNVPTNKNNDITNNYNNNNNDTSNNDNFYFLSDIKLKKLIKCKGLFDIIHSEEELYMIVNKILLKLNKYKKSYNTPNYEKKLQFSLQNLFDSSLHGDTAFQFHSKCDYKYNTISIIETNAGHRFGGYTSECFESPEEYFDKKDNLSFVFSLDKMRIYDVNKGKYAISCDKNYGPYFRDDHICIVDEFFSKESGTCIKGKGFNTTKNYELNSGKKYFTIKRLQVFQIKVKNIK